MVLIDFKLAMMVKSGYIYTFIVQTFGSVRFFFFVLFLKEGCYAIDAFDQKQNYCEINLQ